MRSLGVDPGRLRGAMALVDVEDGRVCVLGWAAWRDRTRKGERMIQIIGRGPDQSAGPYRGEGAIWPPRAADQVLRAWVSLLAGDGCAAAAVEGPLVARGFGPQAAMRVSLPQHQEFGRWVERVGDRLRSIGDGPVPDILTPQANAWRKALGLPVGFQARKGEADERVWRKLEPITTWDSPPPIPKPLGDRGQGWSAADLANLWDAVGVAVFAAQIRSASARPAAIASSTPG